METQYQIMLDSPLGQRSGTLTLREEGGQVCGTLSLLGTDNPVEGTRDGSQLRLRHLLRTRVSRLDCETVLRAAEGALEGTVQVGPTYMRICGIVPPDKIEERKEHT